MLKSRPRLQSPRLQSRLVLEGRTQSYILAPKSSQQRMGLEYQGAETPLAIVGRLGSRHRIVESNIMW